jgi:hypothetical protein
VLSEKKILNETKNHNPPFKLNGRSLKTFRFMVYQRYLNLEFILFRWLYCLHIVKTCNEI